MLKYENECVGYALPCVGYCRYLNAPHYYCDDCGEEFLPNELYYFDETDEMLCGDCLKGRFKKIDHQ